MDHGIMELRDMLVIGLHYKRKVSADKVSADKLRRIKFRTNSRNFENI